MSAFMSSLEGTSIEVVQLLASFVTFIVGKIIPLILKSISIIIELSRCAVTS